jgi:hypothetical protein
MNLDFFVEKSKTIHGDKYLYDKSFLPPVDGKVIVTCPEHGDLC